MRMGLDEEQRVGAAHRFDAMAQPIPQIAVNWAAIKGHGRVAHHPSKKAGDFAASGTPLQNSPFGLGGGWIDYFRRDPPALRHRLHRVDDFPDPVLVCFEILLEQTWIWQARRSDGAVPSDGS